MLTQDNTCGFTDGELAELNAAVKLLISNDNGIRINCDEAEDLVLDEWCDDESLNTAEWLAARAISKILGRVEKVLPRKFGE